MSCDSYEDGECDFGIGFRGEHYDEYDWVGEKCYEYETYETCGYGHVCGGGPNQHHPPSVSK